MKQQRAQVYKDYLFRLYFKQILDWLITLGALLELLARASFSKGP